MLVAADTVISANGLDPAPRTDRKSCLATSLKIIGEAWARPSIATKARTATAPARRTSFMTPPMQLQFAAPKQFKGRLEIVAGQAESLKKLNIDHFGFS